MKNIPPLYHGCITINVRSITYKPCRDSATSYGVNFLGRTFLGAVAYSVIFANGGTGLWNSPAPKGWWIV